jgi:hypothetical protein
MDRLPADILIPVAWPTPHHRLDRIAAFDPRPEPTALDLFAYVSCPHLDPRLVLIHDQDRHGVEPKEHLPARRFRRSRIRILRHLHGKFPVRPH